MDQKFLNIKFAASLTVFWIAVCAIVLAIFRLIDTPLAWISLLSGIPIFILLVAALNRLTSESR